MKKLILLIIVGLLCNGTFAQVIDGDPYDSTMFTFQTYDLRAHLPILIDTAGSGPLWQVGATNKTFSATTGTIGQKMLMTDSANPYPVKANAWFTLRHFYGYNIIVTFMHKYQTRQGKDGGIIEFSVDTGKTWNNMKGDCNKDGGGTVIGLLTENFYAKNDTLMSGEQAFSGNSNGWRTSRFQFFQGFPIKTTGTSGCEVKGDLQVRFRFSSDTLADTLDGWAIGSIKIERDDYGSAVNEIHGYQSLPVYPNPGHGTFNFPVLTDEKTYQIQLLTPIGTKVMNIPYTHALDLSNYPNGMYFYSVSNGQQTYMGKIQLE